MKSALLLLPEGLVLAAALGCLLEDRLARLRRSWLAGAVALLLVVALAAELVFGGQIATAFQGGFRQDRFSLFATAALLLVALLVVLASDWAELGAGSLGLTLLAVFGGLVAATATDLASLWAGLLLALLASLGVTGLADPAAARRLLPAVAALAALVGIGFAAVAGDAGGGTLAAISARLAQPLALPLAIALLVVIGALLAQLAGAPWLGPLAAAAAGLVLVKFLGTVAALGSAWSLLLPGLAAAAMVVGALGAVAGGRTSGIAGWAGLVQLGWLVAGLAGGSRLALGASLFLFGAYLLASAAAPLALGDAPHGLAGLAERSAARAAGFAVCLLSLAGVPPLAGFFGEFAVASQLVRGGLFWLVALGFFASAVVGFAVVRDLRLVYLASSGEVVQRTSGGRLALGGAGLAAAALIAYTFLANPISGLAVQGAAAVGLR